MATSVSGTPNRIIIVRGDSRVLQIAVTDQNYLPVDISGARVRFTARQDAYLASDPTGADPFPYIQKDSNRGSSEAVVTNGPGGICQVSLSSVDTLLMPQGDYHYDVVLDMPGGSTYTAVSDTLRVTETVTRQV